MKKLILFFLTILISLNAQDKEKYPYDLESVVFEPVEFIHDKNVKGKINSLTFTPDGKEVYFSYIDEYRDVKIYFSKYEDGKWSESKEVSFSSNRNDNNPFISEDGKRLYFASQRPLEYNPSKTDYDIWYVERIDSVWGEPVRINNRLVNSPDNEGTPVVDKNGNLYFSSSRKDGFGKNDIYLARFDGTDFTDVVNLGPSVNSAFDDFYPMVDSESNLLLFSSYRGEGNGLAEIYFAELNNFSAENIKVLNGIVNTDGYEYAPYLAPGNKYIFFTRIRGKERKILYINKEVVGVNFNIER